MSLLTDKAITLLGSKTSWDVKTAAATTIYTTPVGKITRITHLVVRNSTASLAGGTSYSLTGWGTAFSLASLVTASTGFVTITFAAATAPTECSEIAASTAVQITVTTGATAAGTATVDVFGFTDSA